MSFRRLLLCLFLPIFFFSCIEIITKVNPAVEPNLKDILVTQSGWAGTAPGRLYNVIDGDEDTSTDEGITLGNNIGLIDFDLGFSFNGIACIKMRLRSIGGYDASWDILTSNDNNNWQKEWNTVDFPNAIISEKLFFANIVCYGVRYIRIRSIGQGESSAATRLYELTF